MVSLRKARRDIDAKLDAALENRTWMKDEEDRKARTVKSEDREMDLRGESIATR